MFESGFWFRKRTIGPPKEPIRFLNSFPLLYIWISIGNPNNTCDLFGSGTGRWSKILRADHGLHGSGPAPWNAPGSPRGTFASWKTGLVRFGSDVWILCFFVDPFLDGFFLSISGWIMMDYYIGFIPKSQIGKHHVWCPGRGHDTVCLPNGTEWVATLFISFWLWLDMD